MFNVSFGTFSALKLFNALEKYVHKSIESGGQWFRMSSGGVTVVRRLVHLHQVGR